MTSGQVVVSPVQMAWLTELGIDRKLLASMADTTAVFAAQPVNVAPAAPVVSKPDAFGGRSAAPGGSGDRAPQPVRPAPGPPQPDVPPPQVPLVRQPLPDNLADLADRVAQCQACGLHAVRHQTVFGDGAVQAPDWMVIGEVPGDHDDHLGLPFQGKAGELLNQMLVAAGLLPSATLFYTNLLKCRPKGARAPRSEEIEACLPFLRQQITLVQPSGLLVLGWQAAQALLGQRASLDQLRGQVHRYHDAGLDIPLVVTHHPASLMLRGHFKAAAWQDLHLARQALPLR
ncbi:MAG: uracil-DNA glycosylase [Pusillimonas sp.]